MKKYKKPPLQKSKTNIFDQKRFLKNLAQISQEKNSGVLRLNQTYVSIANNKQMLTGKLLTNQRLLANVTLF